MQKLIGRSTQLFITLLLTLSACQTYHLSREDLLKQFAHSGKEQKITLLIAAPYFFFPGIVEGNDLTELWVYDKNEKQVMLDVTNHMGVKITRKDSTHVIFYFNTLEIKDSTITGSKTHFFEWRFKPIKLEDVAKIEIQK